jgi:class 3 adenylate cyclase
MVDLVMRIVNLGAARGWSPAEVRRIQTINLILLFGIFYLVLYTTLYAFLDFSELLPVIAVNTVAFLLYGAGLILNSQGKTETAMWLLLGTSILNVALASLLLGTGTGIYLFMAVIPVTGMLISPPNDRTTPLVIIVTSMMAFVVVVLVDPSTPDPIAGTDIETMLLVTSVILTVLMLGVVGLYFKRVSDTAKAELLVAHAESERLLLNVLPAPIAVRLKAGETTIADGFGEVTVLFSDLVGFTAMSAKISAETLVERLNSLFIAFDTLATDLGVEKTKTIGDAYMVVGGLPLPRPDHAQRIADMGLGMVEAVCKYNSKADEPLGIRIGINTGPVVAGVIGSTKFTYDLWATRSTQRAVWNRPVSQDESKSPSQPIPCSRTTSYLNTAASSRSKAKVSWTPTSSTAESTLQRNQLDRRQKPGQPTPAHIRHYAHIGPMIG